jgi:uncharacterized membrane protein YfcA
LFDFSSLTSGEPGVIIIALVAFGAGSIRGFTGFGGPAFMLAILTIFFSPMSIVSKILVVEFFTSAYLFKSCLRQIEWKATMTMVIPTLLFIPLGHWGLQELDPEWMKRAIATIISIACVLMLIGYRYQRPLTTAGLIAIGVVSGVIFGGTFIALVAVVAILLGPYNKNEGRTLIIAWSFFTILGFALVSAISGTTTINDVMIALPGAASYMLGAWLGSMGFRQSSEKFFRRGAIAILLILSVFNLSN